MRMKMTFEGLNVRYVLVRLFTDGTYKYVTDVEFVPNKYCKWEDGKQAYFFDSKDFAESVCLGLNTNNIGCFVMEVPDYFDESKFVNTKEEEPDERV